MMEVEMLDGAGTRDDGGWPGDQTRPGGRGTPDSASWAAAVGMIVLGIAFLIGAVTWPGIENPKIMLLAVALVAWATSGLVAEWPQGGTMVRRGWATLVIVALVVAVGASIAVTLASKEVSANNYDGRVRTTYWFNRLPTWFNRPPTRHGSPPERPESYEVLVGQSPNQVALFTPVALRDLGEIRKHASETCASASLRALSAALYTSPTADAVARAYSQTAVPVLSPGERVRGLKAREAIYEGCMEALSR